MAATLGKRKRSAAATSKSKEDQPQDVSESYSSLIDAQEVFRRHFEARFKPLPVVQEARRAITDAADVLDGQSDISNANSESEWDGISEAEEGAVEVVEHTDAQIRMAAMSKEELKTFMSSKPPPISTPTPSLVRDKAGASVADDDASEAANLKKDLALQRLLAESHLLESSSNPTVTGRNRHKATDMRIQALGSKKSIFTQAKMPMAHRKGIIAKQGEREETRRREARENGIILEKATIDPKKGSVKKRDRGVGAPGIGKFAGGMLKLSKKDISDIEGPRRDSNGRGGGRGRGKRPR